MRWYTQQMTDIDMNLRASRADSINTRIMQREATLPERGGVEKFQVFPQLFGGREATRDLPIRNAPKMDHPVRLDSRQGRSQRLVSESCGYGFSKIREAEGRGGREGKEGREGRRREHN